MLLFFFKASAADLLFWQRRTFSADVSIFLFFTFIVEVHKQTLFCLRAEIVTGMNTFWEYGREDSEMYYNNTLVEAHLFPACLFEAASIIITLSPVATLGWIKIRWLSKPSTVCCSQKEHDAIQLGSIDVLMPWRTSSFPIFLPSLFDANFFSLWLETWPKSLGIEKKSEKDCLIKSQITNVINLCSLPDACWYSLWLLFGFLEAQQWVNPTKSGRFSIWYNNNNNMIEITLWMQAHYEKKVFL